MASASPQRPIAATPWTIGGNVPWSVSWTAEEKFDLQESQDFPGLVDLVQASAPGDGMPKFAALHVTRHRLGMAQHICHVCGKRTLRHNRYIFPVQSGGFVTLSDETTRYAGNVPPVHLACAKRAQRLCPHLSHAYAEPVAFPPEDTRLMPRLDVVEGMEELAKTLPKNMKVVFSCFRLYGPRFSSRVKAMREKDNNPWTR